jgi:PAS domain S-box-containing protein
MVGPDPKTSGSGAAPRPAPPSSDGGVASTPSPDHDFDERFRLVMETAPSAVLLVDDQGRIVLANARAESWLGYEPGELAGLPVSSLVPQHLSRRHAEYVAGFFAAPVGRPIGAGRDLWARRKDGSEFPAEIALTPVRRGAGTMVLASITDISPRKHAEEELRASEERFRTFMTHTPVAAWIVDSSGRFRYVSPGYYRMVGVAGDLTGRSIGDVYPGALGGEYLANNQIVLGQNHAVETVEPGPRADGSPGSFLVTKFPIPLGGETLLGGVALDITEMKRAQDVLRERKEQLGIFVENAPVALAMFDRDMRYVCASDRWRTDHNLGGRDLRGASHYEIFPETPEPWREAHRRGLAGEVVRAEEDQFRRSDGAVQWLRWEVRPWHDASGAVGGILLFTEDITPRKHAEEALRQSDERLRLAQRCANIGIWEWDLKTCKVSWSPELEQQFGFAEGTFPGTYSAFRERVHPDDIAEVERGRDEAVRAHVAFDTDFRVRPQSRQTRWVNSKGAAVYDRDGKPTRLFGVCVDITDRKLAEERKLEAQIQQAQKLESLGIMAGGIAHDFNNILTGILGYAELARHELPPGSRAGELIDEAAKGARRAAELTTQLLAYSGKGHFIVRPLSINAIIEDMRQLIQVSISRKCTVRYSLAPNLPAIEADAAQLRQVIMNLAINASEAMGEGAGLITFTTGSMHCDTPYLSEACAGEGVEEGPYVFLEVSDTGCGMTEETKARIFDPFFSTKFTGRGLGLSAVLGIVRGHRGAITVQSAPGKGTSFRVAFPASERPASPETPRLAARNDWRGSGTVLVVDDEELVRGLVRHMLERMGFFVLTASDGLQAVQMFAAQSDKVRLVLLDMTMPVFDGQETLRELRRIRPDVRVVLCSGFDQQTTTTRFAENPPAAFMQKPYGFEQLQAVLRAVLTQECKAATGASVQADGLSDATCQEKRSRRPECSQPQ